MILYIFIYINNIIMISLTFHTLYTMKCTLMQGARLQCCKVVRGRGERNGYTPGQEPNGSLIQGLMTHRAPLNNHRRDLRRPDSGPPLGHHPNLGGCHVSLPHRTGAALCLCTSSTLKQGSGLTYYKKKLCR